MKFKDLLKVLGSQFLIIKIEDNGAVIDTEHEYYDEMFSSKTISQYNDYNVNYVNAWDYDELRVFIEKEGGL